MAQTSQTNIIRQGTPEAVQICCVLSGMRPTGALHLGHYFGALQSWLHLQARAQSRVVVANRREKCRAFGGVSFLRHRFEEQFLSV